MLWQAEIPRNRRIAASEKRPVFGKGEDLCRFPAASRWVTGGDLTMQITNRIAEAPSATPREDVRTRAIASARRQRQGPRLGRCGRVQRAEPAAGPAPGPLTWATLRVLRALLWRFHGADGGGRCFPAYEKIAAAARAPGRRVAVAIKALEEAGMLSWVNRIARIRRRERDLFGRLVSVWQVIRISNGYSFSDPIDREPGRKAYKSENPTRPQNLDLNKEAGPRGSADNAQLESANVLMMRHGWYRGGGRGCGAPSQRVRRT